MDLTAQLTNLRNNSRNLTANERAEVACRLAKQFEKAGDYEQAYEALLEFWPDRAGEPYVAQLDQIRKAEVLLRIGALLGWLGGAEQTPDSQEIAKRHYHREHRYFSITWAKQSLR